ncbi:MAG: TRAP transporter large permease [Halanaerobiales bacterium]|nr:TRAP transporter large permease [Halanaerobiales bacterium]
MELMIGIIGVIIFLILLFMGVHISLALLGVGFLGFAALSSFGQSLDFVARTIYQQGSRYSFAVIPLFMLMGYFANSSGIVDKAFKLTSAWLSNIKGGLYWVAIATSTLFAAATGSGAAATISIGKILYPQMTEKGYNKRISLACLAASGTIGVLIPPSIPLVLYGTVTGENIGSLLLAGVIPGLLEAAIYSIGLILLMKFRPKMLLDVDKREEEKKNYTMKEKLKTLPGAWGIALILIIIIGGIYSGFFTPNEAGAVGAFVTFILLILRHKGKSFSIIKKDVWETASVTAMVFFIVIGSMVFSNFLTFSGIFEAVSVVQQFSPLVALIIFVAVFFVMGMFMNSMAALLIIAPLAYSILTPYYSGIWLGLIMVKMFEIGGITPPVGFSIFVAKSLDKDIPVEELYKGTFVFWVMDLITLAIMIALPQIVLWLPNLAR